VTSEAAGAGKIFCSIVIPCYNEEANIPRLLAGFAEALKARDLELILVDNGSSDGTGQLLRRCAPDYPFLRVVSCSPNRGYGGGIMAGLREARGDLTGWAHGDMQYSPADILEAAERMRPFRAENVFLKGLRKNRTSADAFFTAAMAAFASLTLRIPLRDINAQPTIFSRSLMEDWQDPPADFSLDLYAYAAAIRRGFKLLRREIPLADRKEGASSWNRGPLDRLRLSMRMVKVILRNRTSLMKGDRDA
jgi:glycosyltransferase involved in cell wall biosynthesis